MVFLFALTTALLTACKSDDSTVPDQSQDTSNQDTSYQDFVALVGMRDGEGLWTQVSCPDGPGPFSTVLHRTPYLSDQLLPSYQALAALRVSEGHCAVLQSVRGTWRSEGEIDAFAQEQNDGFDTVSWIVEQDWSDGALVTQGSSYDGYAALAAAAHPAVKVVIADGPIFDPLHGSPSLRGGVLSLDPLWWFYLVEHGEWPSSSEIALATNQRPIEDADELLLGSDLEYWNSFLAHQDDPTAEFWEAQRLGEAWAKTCASVLLIKANAERFEGPVLAYQALLDREHCEQAQTFLAVGSTTHGAFVSYWGSSREEAELEPIYELADRLLASALSGGGPLTDPSVQFRPENSDTWQSATAWPPETVEDRSFFLGPSADSGTLGDEPGSGTGSFTSDPQGTDPCSSDDYPDSLWFSVALGEETTVAGTPSLDLQLSATSLPTEVHAILWAWSPEHDWQLVSHGGVRVKGQAGDTLQATIRLQPMTITLPADAWLGLSLVGSRCAVAEFSNTQDWASAPSGKVSEITVHGAGSVLRVPLSR